MKKNLWVKLISVLLILATAITLVACDSDGDDFDDIVKNNIRAEDLEASEGFTFSLTPDKKGYQLKSAAKCQDKELVIPSTHTGVDGVTLPVTVIAAGAFKNNKTAVTVYIPDSVTKISGTTAGGAFTDAASVKTVICGSGLTEISRSAFQNCPNLLNVLLKPGLIKIGDYAFADCKNLQKIVIPDTVETIGASSFQCCVNLRSVTLGSGIKTQDTLDENGELVLRKVEGRNEYEPVKKVEEIGKFAFYFCKSIKTINYTGTVEEFKKLHLDVSCFLSTTLTDVIVCSDGEVEIPKLEGQNELPDSFLINT